MPSSAPSRRSKPRWAIQGSDAIEDITVSSTDDTQQAVIG